MIPTSHLPPEPLQVQQPLDRRSAFAATARCAGATASLLAHRRVHLPRHHVGLTMQFADDTEARVYRETVLAGPPPADPCVLVVEFRLRGIHGSLGHAGFRAESILNTPLFVGFPGFLSKLWLANDTHGTYRGFYEWDGPLAAEHYARSLWRVLELVSERGSIGYHVLPGVRRDALLGGAAPLGRGDGRGDSGRSGEWWELVAAG